MSECVGDWKDLLPEVASGRAPADVEARVLAHARGCADCAAELDLLRGLARGRPELPGAVAARIAEGVRQGLARERDLARERRRRPAGAGRWAVAAAAVAVLAMGAPWVLVRTASSPPSDLLPPGEPVTVWLTDEPLVAGGPMLDGLSDDELRRLLEEMDG